MVTTANKIQILSTIIIIGAIFFNDSKERILVKERQVNVMKFLEEHREDHEYHDKARLDEVSALRNEFDMKLAKTAIDIRSYEDTRQKMHDATWPPAEFVNRLMDVENCLITSNMCSEYQRQTSKRALP